MTNVHLEIAQLWRCPVEWCVLWKSSVRACQEHLMEKHGCSSLFDLQNVAKFFTPWTVSCHVWQTALRPDVSGVAVDARLFHEAGCRLVHRYRVYEDLFPHPALLASSPVCARPWPSPGSLTCGSLFRRRERHLARSQLILFRGGAPRQNRPGSLRGRLLMTFPG